MNLQQRIEQKTQQLLPYQSHFKAQVGDAFNLETLAKLLVNLETVNSMTPQLAEMTEYAKFIPVKSNFNAVMGTKTVLSRKKGVGKGQVYSGTGGDIPLAEVEYDKIELGFQMGTIGYQYSIAELATASHTGISLQEDKVQSARLAFERHMSDIAWLGDEQTGLHGLFNQTGVDIHVATKAWETATPEEILKDIDDVLYAMLKQTEHEQGVTPDTVILPASLMRILTSRRLDDHLEKTLFKWLQENNAFALQNKPLAFYGSSRPETLGKGNTRRITFYRKDPSCLEMRIAQDLTFLPPQANGLDLFTPGHYLYQGVWLKRVDSLRYLDVANQ